MTSPTLDRRSFTSLGRALRDWRVLRTPKIGAALRELIILHVSSVNGCPVCSVAHGLAGRASGLGREDIRAARACEPTDPRFDERTRVALRYAELRTLDQERAHTDEGAEFAALFDPEEQREVRAIVDLFTFNNRFNNTWERWLPGAERRRERLGLCDLDREKA
ncbi:MAG: carboxymuconolactone decarboxylase family protein [Polyangiaceae bacterium]